MVEVLIGLGVLIIFGWVIAGIVWVMVEGLDLMSWRFHLAVFPWYVILLKFAYAIGSEWLRG